MINEMTFEEKIEAIYFYKQRKGYIEYWLDKTPENIKEIIDKMKEHMSKGGVEFDGKLETIEQFIEQLLNSIGEPAGKTYVYGIYHENNYEETINYCYFTHNRKFTENEFEIMFNKARQACEEDYGVEYPCLANLWQKMNDIYGFDLYNPDIALVYLEASDDEHIKINVNEIYNKENIIETVANKVAADAMKYNENRRDHVNDFILEYIIEVHEAILDKAMKKIEEEKDTKEKEINDTIDQFFNEMSEKYNIKFDSISINDLWRYNK